MKFKILTLFPEMFSSYFSSSIMKRALGKNLISIEIIDIRNYTKDKYGRVDTPPIGGGAGLIMKCQPVVDCLKATTTKDSYKIVLSPRGNKFTEKEAVKLSSKKEIVIMCGHYEGFDERLYDYFDESISIGDYILTGGELASMCIIDAVSRLIKGVISDASTEEESFTNTLLEYPQYTEPYDYEGKKVPDILYSGNHEAISKYHKMESFRITKSYRPDLYQKYIFTKQDLKIIKDLDSENKPKWELDAIEKGSKFTKNH